MMQSMKGATQLLGSMNRQMNLPALTRIAMEFERENDIMDQRQEMMDDAIDEVTGPEDEEEGEEVVNQVLDEIGVDLGQSVSSRGFQSCMCLLNPSSWAKHHKVCRAAQSRRVVWRRQSEAILEMMTCRRDLIVSEDNLGHLHGKRCKQQQSIQALRLPCA